jgi:hypothetical protein
MGWNRLVDVLNADIVDVARGAICSRGCNQLSPYGRGDTAMQIVEHIGAKIIS